MRSARQERVNVDVCRPIQYLVRQNICRTHRHGPAEGTMAGVDEQPLDISCTNKWPAIDQSFIAMEPRQRSQFRDLTGKGTLQMPM